MSTRSAVVRLSADVSGLIAGYQKAKLATADLARTGMANAAAHKKALDTVAKGALGIGAAAAAGLGYAIKTAADFDQKMSLVQAATGETTKVMGDLREAAIQAGADTVFSAGEAADGITNLGKAGISASDILAGGLTGALNLAAAGELDVASAAEDIATAMTQFSLKGSDATHVADLLSAGANKAQGEVSDLAYALNYAGLPAHALGVSIEETTGTLALFAKNGLIGSQAGTSLRGVLSSLASPSAAAANVMDDLGIKVFDAHGKFKGLDGAAQELHDSMRNLTQEERQNALGKIFSNAQLQAANILYSNGAEGVRKWTHEVNDSGAAARTAATKLDNLKGDLEQLGGSLQTALIGTGEGSQGMLRGVTQDLTGLVNRYNDLSDAQKGVVATGLGVTALLGVGTFVSVKAIQGVIAAKDAFSELGWTFGTTKALLKGGIVVGAIIGLDILGEQLFAAENSASDLRQAIRRLSYGMDSGLDLDFGFDTMGDQIHEAAQEAHIFGSSDLGRQILAWAPGFTKTSDNIADLDAKLAAYAKVAPARARAAFAELRQQARDAGVDLADFRDQFQETLKVLEAPRKQKSWMISSAALLSGLTGLNQYREALMKLPTEVLTKVTNPGALTSLKSVQKLAKQYDLTRGEVTTIMRARDFASKDIEKVLKALHLLKREHPKPTIDADSKPLENRYRVAKGLLDDVGHAKPMASLEADPRNLLDSTHRSLLALGIIDRKTAMATLDANYDPVLAAVAAAQRSINNLHGTTVTNYIDTVHRMGGPQGAPVATGGYIRGPGTTTSDSIQARLSDREFVVKAAAVERYGVDFMHRVNSMQLADGGYVSRSPAVVTSSGGGGGWASGPVQLVVDGQAFTAYLRAVSRTEARDVVTRTATHQRRTGS